MPRLLTCGVLALTLFLVSAQDDVPKQLQQGWNPSFLVAADDLVEEEREVVAVWVPGSNDSTLFDEDFPDFPLNKDKFENKITLIEVYSGYKCPKKDFARIENGGVGMYNVRISFKGMNSSEEPCLYHVRIRITGTEKFEEEKIKSQLKQSGSRIMATENNHKNVIPLIEDYVLATPSRKNDTYTSISYPEYDEQQPIFSVEVYALNQCKKKKRFASIVAGGVGKRYVRIKLSIQKPGPKANVDTCIYLVKVNIKNSSSKRS